MIVKLLMLLNLLLGALTGGMYWGPWLALSRSLNTFEPLPFLAVVQRLNQNMAPLMTVLTPLSLLAHIPVVLLTYTTHPLTAWCTLAGFLCFLAAMIVTVAIEVPIVKQIITWTLATMPPGWEQLRNRWQRFHIVRVAAGIAGLLFLLTGVLFG